MSKSGQVFEYLSLHKYHFLNVSIKSNHEIVIIRFVIVCTEMGKSSVRI